MATTSQAAAGATSSPASQGVAIHAENLSKVYRVYEKPLHRIWDLILPGKKRHKEFWAVRNVYLDIPHGSTVGIIGENGAGKSTLAQAPDRHHQADDGKRSTCRGRIASLLELGAGFHPEFSGRENIYLNCSILGMSEEEIDERYQSHRRLLGAR